MKLMKVRFIEPTNKLGGLTIYRPFRTRSPFSRSGRMTVIPYIYVRA